MRIKEAKDFIKELEHKLVDEAIDIYADENEKYLSNLFEVIEFALKNLVPEVEIDDNKNKCMSDCPFYTVENRKICSKLCPENNCYQCVVKTCQLYESSNSQLRKNNDELHKQNLRIPLIENEIIQLKAKLYDKSMGENK